MSTWHRLHEIGDFVKGRRWARIVFALALAMTFGAFALLGVCMVVGGLRADGASMKTTSPMMILVGVVTTPAAVLLTFQRARTELQAPTKLVGRDPEIGSEDTPRRDGHGA